MSAKSFFGFVTASSTSNCKRVLYCVGVPGVQPPEYTGGHRQHGCHCQAVGCGDWGGGGHSDCEMSFLYVLYPNASLALFFSGIGPHIHSLIMHWLTFHSRLRVIIPKLSVVTPADGQRLFYPTHPPMMIWRGNVTVTNKALITHSEASSELSLMCRLHVGPWCDWLVGWLCLEKQLSAALSVLLVLHTMKNQSCWQQSIERGILSVCSFLFIYSKNLRIYL